MLPGLLPRVWLKSTLSERCQEELTPVGMSSVTGAELGQHHRCVCSQRGRETGVRGTSPSPHYVWSSRQKPCLRPAG